MLIILFILGTIIGSYVNSVVFRLGLGTKDSPQRSYCLHCFRTLEPKDLIPLISFLILRGKCRYCKQSISYRYLIGELVMGGVFVLVGLNHSYLSVNLGYYLIVASVLTALFFTDLYEGVLPDKIVFLGVIITLIYLVISQRGLTPLINSIISGLASALFFFTFVYFSKGKALGLGDVKFAFWLGLLLGWPEIALALFIAFLTGALCGVILILLRVKKFGQTIPFGPFLSLGSLATLVWGKQILNWYLSLAT